MEICIPIVAKTSELAVVPIKNQISYIFKYEGKLENLKNGVEKLKDERKRVRHVVEEAQRRGGEIELGCGKMLSKRAEKESKAIVELLNEADKFSSDSVFYRPAPQEIMTAYVRDVSRSLNQGGLYSTGCWRY
ncbi:uncharacterized protein LOC111277485 [Durio zibethinus]|uniref:Uncharacterized protein LOC111277485 n=1 Tax=Durio zibethinus TaxID=66656 RepID=A0A6P5WU76_DURZI|nr:uncharacterized protein LOC111277485 [Durio zibethinus]